MLNGLLCSFIHTTKQPSILLLQSFLNGWNCCLWLLPQTSASSPVRRWCGASVASRFCWPPWGLSQRSLWWLWPLVLTTGSTPGLLSATAQPTQLKTTPTTTRTRKTPGRSPTRACGGSAASKVRPEHWQRERVDLRRRKHWVWTTTRTRRGLHYLRPWAEMSCSLQKTIKNIENIRSLNTFQRVLPLNTYLNLDYDII